jgi:hypothetical protein
VTKDVPDRQIPLAPNARHRLHTEVDPVWLQEPEFRARHAAFRTPMALAMALVEEALRGQVPCGVVVFDAWYLAEELVPVLARRRNDWSSVLKTNRLLETASVHLREAHGWPLQRPSPHRAVENLVPLMPAQAYRSLTVAEPTSGGFPRVVRIPPLGQVRIVVSCAHASLTGRSVVLVTNRVDGNAPTIVRLYGPRWPTETFSQDSKGPLGFHA